MKQSAIGWTDFSGGDLNFVTGCTPISEGCQNCYARAIYKRFGRDFRRVDYSRTKLNVLKRKRFPQWSPKRGDGYRPMAFVCDTGDLFHTRVSGHFLMEAFDIMQLRSDVIWQVLTKRPEEMRDFIESHEPYDLSRPPDNIWLGVTAENQERADERIPILLDTPAAVRFVSVEPMLSAVDLSGYMPEWDHRPEHEYWKAAFPDTDGKKILVGPGVDWFICGAESGPNRRPFDVNWARDLYSQCHDANVPFFGKQGSGLHPGAPLFPWGELIHEWPQR